MEQPVASLPEEQPLHSFRFRAMNTTIECQLQCPPEQRGELEQLARDWFERAEKRFSRFRADSELSDLNRLAGERCMISAAMAEVLQLANMYKELTEELFDPFVLNALLEAGYDDSFDIVKRRTAADREPVKPEAANRSRNRMPKLDIDPVMKSVQLPPNAAIDLGGIAKSWSAHRLAEYFLLRRGIKRGLVNAGGDLAVWGGYSESGSEPWRIAVENPWTDETKSGIILMHNGAAATSGTLGRRWMSPQGPMHHLIDPAAMRPSSSDIVQCTVSGSNAVECEIWSKTVCIAGSGRGLSLFAAKASPDCEALLFTADRRTLFCGRPESLGAKWQGISGVRLIPKDGKSTFGGEIR